MKPTYILLFISFFFSTELFSQQGLGVMVDRAQQALTDLGNRSSRQPKPLKIKGTHYFNDNFEVISKNGISIFIDPPKSLLVERIKNSTNRPLFQNKNNIKKKVDELYELRKTIYKKSNYIISSNLKKETLSIIKLES